MWSFWNKIIEKAKRISIFKAIYRVPFVPYIYHLLLAFFGAVIYGFPSKKIKVIGITGTKGKSTTLEMLSSILEASGHKTALLSSIMIKIAEESQKNKIGNTMPGRFFIQAFLNRAVKMGCEYALIEVASQGVVFSRHKFINWHAVAITNLAPEHIEAHGSFEKYRRAKYRFLKYALKQGADVFINSSNDGLDWFREKIKSAKLVNVKDCPEIPGNSGRFFPGIFSRENLAVAVALARNEGIGAQEISSGISLFRGVPGRMEIVKDDPYRVIVDYAHTPDSLEAAYSATKESLSGHLICVLGSCGGGRDKWKRPVMGSVAAMNCNKIFLTSEDPFDEDPLFIIKDVERGIKEVGFSDNDLKIVKDRKQAIKDAIKTAKDGDAVIITGKGSEPFYHEAGKKIPWSDREVAEDAIESRN